MADNIQLEEQEGNWLRRLRPLLNNHQPTRAMQKRAKFDEGKAKTDFPKFVAAMETEVFRNDFTNADKIECLRQLATGDHAVKIAEALETHAIGWANDNPAAEGGEGPECYLSPIKGVALAASAPYAPAYIEVRSVAIRAVLGEDALTDMEEVLNNTRQDRQDVESFNRSFLKAINLYTLTGGPSVTSNLHQYRRLYRGALNDSISSRFNMLHDTLEKEMAAAHSIERSMKASGTLPKAPSAFVMRSTPAPTIDRGSAELIAAIKACSSTLDLVKQLDVFSRGVCQKGLDQVGILTSHAKGGLDLNRIANDTVAKAEAGIHILPIIASIHHLLPSELIKETYRSTRITEKHQDLTEVTKGELKRLRKLKVEANKKDLSSSDDDDDMEDRPDSKRRRSSRNTPTAAAFTKVAEGLQRLSGSQAELLQSVRAAFYTPTAAVLHNAPPFQPQHQAQAQAPAPFLPPLPPPLPQPFPNKNTSRSIPKPWRLDHSWDGCKRCHALCHNRADECPGKDHNTPFCHYCCQDGHSISTCPELAKKSCKSCGRKGNDSRHCDCSRSGTKNR